MREEVWRVGTTGQAAPFTAFADDSQAVGTRFALLCIFHVVFAAIGGSVLFCFLQCHRLPCSSFNFLIEECIYRCPFCTFFLIMINFGLM